eukprot:TRINITY_DN13553_c0_g1_i1.p1 TRINITY_DN13553_c0_g1~~TRINITY_DN13553_c0_g1_i1.p1  ORF type:complete len:323 (+),score=34.86 TRINITY_DN13553_c0_g1_i1:114-1082(+)
MAVLTSMFFPLSNMLAILLADSSEHRAETKLQQQRTLLADVLARYVRYMGIFAISYLTYAILPHPGKKAEHWSLDWMLLVLLRNELIVHALYGGFHWVLYDNRWTRDKVRGQKFWDANLREDGSLDPTKGYDPVRDRRLTTIGVAVASGIECIVLHLWAAGQWNVYDDFWSQPVRSCALIAALPYWADFHFFFIHRAIHPWFARDTKYFDPGRVLYKYVHSVHHKSYNTGPWSGLAMHPFEQFLFFSSVLVPLMQHPLHFYLGFFHKVIAPLAGHDGFAEPGGDGYFHFLHHKHYEVNYGSPTVPLDKIFGSFSDGSRCVKK